jgi:hypothetical protein
MIPANLTKLQGFKPCPECGCNEKLIGPGSGPHAARLDCAECGRFIQWVKRSEVASLGKIGAVIGGGDHE